MDLLEGIVVPPEMSERDEMIETIRRLCECLEEWMRCWGEDDGTRCLLDDAEILLRNDDKEGVELK